MNWLKKLPNTIRSATGMEWRLLRKLPWIALLGTLLPLLGLGLLHLLTEADTSAAHIRWLQLADYVVLGVVIFHWSMLITIAIGCVLVIVMKGPGYVADAYPVSHSDRPRQTMQTDEEAASTRPQPGP